MSDLDNAREVLTAYDELVDGLRARVAELEAALTEILGLAIMPDASSVYALWPDAIERARAALAQESNL